MMVPRSTREKKLEEIRGGRCLAVDVKRLKNKKKNDKSPFKIYRLNVKEG